MKRPRILLGDDHAIVLDGLRRILEPHCDIVGSAEDGRALVAAAEKLRPELVVADISMPLLNGIEAARQIRKAHPQTKVIFLTMHPDATYATEAFRAGASGYVLKNSAASELVTAIQEVLKGRTYLTPRVAKEAIESWVQAPGQSEAPSASLTSRQREILQLVAEGKSAKEIASILTISPRTVEFHKYRIMAVLGLRTTAELTQYALKHGIVSV
jgi:DNA-binding NarL/FixJ family response regulator